MPKLKFKFLTDSNGHSYKNNHNVNNQTLHQLNSIDFDKESISKISMNILQKWSYFQFLY